MTEIRITLAIKTTMPGEIVRALREQARQLRNHAGYSRHWEWEKDIYTTARVRAAELEWKKIAHTTAHAKAAELEQVADQILRTER